MKFRLVRVLFLVLLISFAVSSCFPVASPAGTSMRKVTDTPQALPDTAGLPSVDNAAQAFLKAWQVEDYPAMYDMLAPASQDAIAFDTFTKRYKDAAITMTLASLDFKILSASRKAASAQVNYQVSYHTRMVGDLTAEMAMNFTRVNDTWRVLWDDSLILPALKGGNTLVMDIKSPTRGNIYDRNGNAVAAAGDVIGMWIIKGQTDPAQEASLLGELSKLTGKPPEAIQALYLDSNIPDGTIIPVGEVLRSEAQHRAGVLAGLSGLFMQDYSGRFYFNEGIAPHVTGYVSAIQQGEEEKYLREGFRIDDRVGRTGLELWGEQHLLGQRGAALYVNNPQGVLVTRLGQVESRPSQSIYMTIDKNLQLEAQQAITGFNGAIVVLERNTGRVLAMVSSPGFDPNAFEFKNPNFNVLLQQINGDGRARQYNRATGQGYPLGSVFKIISMAAALETGAFVPEDTYNCQYNFTEIDGVVLHDWTLEYGAPPSGVLTLPQGLMRSCNPWFYHIGVTLYQQGRGAEISKMARAFGLGSLTGIEGVREEPGNIQEPTSDVDAARLAIGQSTVLVNPLQVARFVAAVGNGGTLYRPQVVEKIADLDGNASFAFKPIEQGKLPVKPENLRVIQEAMYSVVNERHGTAVQVFSGLNISVSGKTGTAQSDKDLPHAWFAGYTDAQRADKPDIAFAVLAEYAGEGSEVAAPIARRLLEVYFYGRPQTIYPWEARINVPRESGQSPFSPIPQDSTPTP